MAFLTLTTLGMLRFGLYCSNLKKEKKNMLR